MLQIWFFSTCNLHNTWLTCNCLSSSQLFVLFHNYLSCVFGFLFAHYFCVFSCGDKKTCRAHTSDKLIIHQCMFPRVVADSQIRWKFGSHTNKCESFSTMWQSSSTGRCCFLLQAPFHYTSNQYTEINWMFAHSSTRLTLEPSSLLHFPQHAEQYLHHHPQLDAVFASET